MVGEPLTVASLFQHFFIFRQYNGTIQRRNQEKNEVSKLLGDLSIKGSPTKKIVFDPEFEVNRGYDHGVFIPLMLLKLPRVLLLW